MRKYLLIFLMPLFAFALGSHVNGKQQIVTAASMGASLNSRAVDISNFDNVNIQAKWTGITASGGSGTFKIQGSSDSTLPCSSTTIWTDQTGTSVAIAADGDQMWNLAAQGMRCIRLVYTRTAGTGTLNAHLNGKGT